MIYKLVLLFSFWICTCPEMVGEDAMCPKHGLAPAVIRFIVLFAVMFVIVVFFLK